MAKKKRDRSWRRRAVGRVVAALPNDPHHPD